MTKAKQGARALVLEPLERRRLLAITYAHTWNANYINSPPTDFAPPQIYKVDAGGNETPITTYDDALAPIYEGEKFKVVFPLENKHTETTIFADGSFLGYGTVTYSSPELGTYVDNVTYNDYGYTSAAVAAGHIGTGGAVTLYMTPHFTAGRGEFYFDEIGVTCRQATYTLSITGPATEGGAAATGRVRRDGDALLGALPFAVQPTGSGAATFGDDFTLAGDTGQFLPGEIEKTFSITGIDDDELEWTEDFELEVIDPTPEQVIDVSNGKATGRVVNTDKPSITGLPDDFIITNNDDDNANGVLDCDEEAAFSDDDLIPISLVVPQDAKPGAKVRLFHSGGNLRIWKDPQRSQALTTYSNGVVEWDTGQVPSTVYVEAIGGNTTLNGEILQLSTIDSGPNPSDHTIEEGVSTVKLTVVNEGRKAEAQYGVVHEYVGAYNSLGVDYLGPAQFYSDVNIDFTAGGPGLTQYLPKEYEVTQAPSSVTSAVGALRQPGSNLGAVGWMYQTPGRYQSQASLTLSGHSWTAPFDIEVALPTVTEVRRSIGFVGLRDSGSRIGLQGVFTNDGKEHGFVWENLVTLPTGFVVDAINSAPAPKFGHVQLVTLDEVWYRMLSNGNQEVVTIANHGKEGLDTDFPYALPKKEFSVDELGRFQDSPAFGMGDVVGYGKGRMDFRTQIMFHAGGAADSWIPLKEITWFFAVEWNPTPGATDAAGNPVPYAVVNATEGSTAPVSSTSFQTWTFNWAIWKDAHPLDGTRTPESWDMPWD